jgi:hypothetical protein
MYQIIPEADPEEGFQIRIWNPSSGSASDIIWYICEIDLSY